MTGGTIPERYPPIRAKSQAAAMVPLTIASCQPVLRSISFLQTKTSSKSINQVLEMSILIERVSYRIMSIAPETTPVS